MKKRVEFTKDMLIYDAVLHEPAQKIFQELGLKCVSCIAAEKESLYFAAVYHDVPLEKILEALNKLEIYVDDEPEQADAGNPQT